MRECGGRRHSRPPIVSLHVRGHRRVAVQRERARLCLFPPLEHAPDQIASRPFVTLSVIDVPTLNDADPVLPTFTLIPAGLDVTRSPLRPVAKLTRNCPGRR